MVDVQHDIRRPSPAILARETVAPENLEAHAGCDRAWASLGPFRTRRDRCGYYQGPCSEPSGFKLRGRQDDPALTARPSLRRERLIRPALMLQVHRHGEEPTLGGH